MNRSLTTTLLTALLVGSTLLGQNLGDQATAGFNDSRTYLNSDAGNFKPPLELDRTLSLPEGTTAQTLSVFEEYVLIGQGGDAAHYSLLDRETGSPIWTFDLPTVTPNPLDYVPAFSDGIVLLGGSTSTSVTAVEVSSGEILWQDDRVGSSDGRLPLLLNDLALYSGEWGVVAARPNDGALVWQYPSSAEMGTIQFAKAPLSSFGSRVYGVQEDGSLFALDLLTGVPAWSAPGIGSDASNVIATRKFIYVTDSSNGTVSAVRSDDGSVAWSVDVGESFSGPVGFGNPGIALAYDTLFVFSGTWGGLLKTVVLALDPETGALRWETIDSQYLNLSLGPPIPPQPPQSGLLANNAVYFYNPWTGRIRARDAFSGNTRWSINLEDVAGMTVADGELSVLFPDRIEVYAPSNAIYLAQIADGMGSSTLITLTNLSSDVAEGTIEFLDDDGNPIQVPVENEPEPTSSLSFQLQPNEALAIQTAGISEPLSKGWARVTASRPVAGTAIYQVRAADTALFEAGVGAAQPTGQVSVFGTTRSDGAAGRMSTALAVANPMQERATVYLRFRFQPVQSEDLRTSFTLEPGQHLAEFIDELFPDLANVGATGTLIIESEVPVVVTALRTQNGFPMSSYPVGIP